MICAAQHDVVVQLLAAQIEEAVLEPDLLGIFLLAEHRQRQLGGRPQHLDLVDIDLDRAGRQVGVLGAVRAAAHLAVDADHPFGAQRLGDLEGRAVGIGDHLGQAVMVAQVDEQQAAVVAHAVAPSRTAARPCRCRCRAARRRYGCGNGACLEIRSESNELPFEGGGPSTCRPLFVKATPPPGPAASRAQIDRHCGRTGLIQDWLEPCGFEARNAPIADPRRPSRPGVTNRQRRHARSHPRNRRVPDRLPRRRPGPIHTRIATASPPAISSISASRWRRRSDPTSIRSMCGCPPTGVSKRCATGMSTSCAIRVRPPCRAGKSSTSRCRPSSTARA